MNARTAIIQDNQPDGDRIITSSPRDPLAKPLLEALVGEYTTRYHDVIGREPDAATHEVYHRYPPEAFEAPHGGFILLLRKGVPVAGGAFMAHADPQTTEFKRIWTHADHRRQGLAKRVVEALEQRAAALGYARIYLTTGFRQPEAEALYKGLGYTALYDPLADREGQFTLPFEKAIAARREAQSA